MNRATYREHRIPTSLAKHVGQSPTSEGEIRAMAAAALNAGVIMFLRADLERLPWASREIIEAEAKRLYGSAGR